METLLEVGLVEALAAGAFIGFCAFVSFLLRSPNKMTEAELTEMLHQISQPDTSNSENHTPTPPPLSYRGNRYNSPKELLTVDEPEVEICVEPSATTDAASTPRVPHAVVRLTYRGVSYVQPRYEENEDSSGL